MYGPCAQHMEYLHVADQHGPLMHTRVYLPEVQLCSSLKIYPIVYIIGLPVTSSPLSKLLKYLIRNRKGKKHETVICRKMACSPEAGVLPLTGRDRCSSRLHRRQWNVISARRIYFQGFQIKSRLGKWWGQDMVMEFTVLGIKSSSASGRWGQYDIPGCQ